MNEIIKLLESGVNLTKVFPEQLEIAKGNIVLQRVLPKTGMKLPSVVKFDREKLHQSGWPINPGTYKVRDPISPVAVICPAQDSVLQEVAIYYGAAISGPCITPDRGVELVITNIVSNPNIRLIILAGKDSGHLAGDVIYCVNKYGVDLKKRRVLRTKSPTNPYLMNLKDEVIARFQRQVQVINLLGDYNEEETERIKLELGLVIRCCLQEPENPIKLINHNLGDEFYLYDPGTENLEPMIVDLSVTAIGSYYEGYDRVGTTIHATTIAEAYLSLMSHVINKGSFGMQESTRMALSALATQTVIHNTTENLVPPGWRPSGRTTTDKEAEDYLKKYSVWVYLFPLSDVRYDPDEEIFVPYIPKQMDYVYGGRLTAYWYELADKDEQEAIKGLVTELHQRFRYKLPTFEDVVTFYEELAQIQRKSFNQLYDTAKAAKLCVKEGFGNSYRLYMSLQTPPIDIKKDPRRAHNPCFALFEVYPRRIGNTWQLDTCLFLRAHDILAFPANANGGIMIQKFLAWYAGISPGLYVHHAGSMEVCDYLLPKEILAEHFRLSKQ
ncbi:MAG: hypothetical protein ABH876_02175 [Patescibacteria group bacterium]|nr:hypothetical protein [Patescibacteria group bacterium]MBU1876878.1 hypothetical protein [Patescibacteria group bacterium]